MAGNTYALPVSYDRETFQAWNDLFGSKLTKIIESRLDGIARKYPGKAKNVTIQFDGDLNGVTAKDVENQLAHVTARPIVMAKQTRTGKIIGFFKSISRHFKRKVYTPVDYNINVTIVCSVVVTEP